MRHSIHRPVIVLAGLLVVLSAQVRAEDSTRDTIIQGVRDDVRRKIEERGERPAESPEQLASGVKQQPAPPAETERASPKPEPTK
jgi:hypothetical protein